MSASNDPYEGLSNDEMLAKIEEEWKAYESAEYQQGQDAFYNGGRCPYRKPSEKHRLWHLGKADAKQQELNPPKEFEAMTATWDEIVQNWLSHVMDHDD